MTNPEPPIDEPHAQCVLQEIRQLSLHIRMEDRTMWDEYKTILNGVRAAGFHPYYVTKQVLYHTSHHIPYHRFFISCAPLAFFHPSVPRHF